MTSESKKDEPIVDVHVETTSDEFLRPDGITEEIVIKTTTTTTKYPQKTFKEIKIETTKTEKRVTIDIKDKSKKTEEIISRAKEIETQYEETYLSPENGPESQPIALPSTPYETDSPKVDVSVNTTNETTIRPDGVVVETVTKTTTTTTTSPEKISKETKIERTITDKRINVDKKDKSKKDEQILNVKKEMETQYEESYPPKRL